MARVPNPITEFLSSKRIAVAGVSRQAGQAANAVYRKPRDCGFEVFPVNPKAEEVEGTRCYCNLSSIPGALDGVVVATHPSVSVELVRECSVRSVGHVWFHRSFGQGSVSNEAVRECEKRSIKCILGGCPLMYCEPVDFGQRCMRWWLRLQGRLPG